MSSNSVVQPLGDGAGVHVDHQPRTAEMIREDPVTADGPAVGVDPEQIGGYVALGPVDEYGGDPPLPVQFGEGVQAVLVDPAFLEDAVALSRIRREPYFLAST